MTRAPISRSRRARTGFTLVELMIAMAAGSFAIAGIYYLANLSARAYNEQMMVSDTQMALRTALEQIRRDFGRAGFLGSRNTASLAEHVPCNGLAASVSSGARIQGISVTANGSLTGDVPALLNTGENLTRADLVQLWGNYTTSDAYLAAGTSSSSQLYFQTTRESFRRSFFDAGVAGGAPSYNPERFAAAFQNRWVRVEQGGRYWFRQVASVSTAGTSETGHFITLTNPLPDTGGCYTTGPGTIVSPLTRISYSLQAIAANGPLARLRAADVAGAQRAVLVRQEEDIATGAVIDGSERVVLDYAVEFSVDGIVDTAPAGTPPVFAYATPTSAITVDTVSLNTPEQFRAVRITLSARAADANPRLPALTRATLDDPLMVYNVPVGDLAVGFRAAVRSMQAEIFLPNLMARPQ